MGGDRPRGSNRGEGEGRKKGKKGQEGAFHASILALKCDSRERGQNAEISVRRPPSLAEFTTPSRCVRSRGGRGRGTKISRAAFAMQITRIHIYATGVDIPLTCTRTNRPILFFFFFFQLLHLYLPLVS